MIKVLQKPWGLHYIIRASYSPNGWNGFNFTITLIHLAPKPYSNNVVLWNALLWLSGRSAGKISSKLFVDGPGLDLCVKTDGQIC
jgi:hypothetical protein